MKNNIYIIVSIVIVLGISAFVGYGKLEKNQTAVVVDTVVSTGIDTGTLIVTSPAHDFGSISMRNGIVKHEFEIKNVSDVPMTVTDISTSCMCTNAIIVRGQERIGPFGMPGHGGARTRAKETIEPDETFIVEAIFDPAAHGPAGIGPITRSISLGGKDFEPLELQFSALVTP